VAIAAILLAACSSPASSNGVVSLVDPSASPSSPASAAPSVDPADAMLAYARCMREHGVDMPDPKVDSNGGVFMGIEGGEGNGPDQDTLIAAQKACESLMPKMGEGNPTATMDPEVQDKMLAFAKCMREHGVPMSDPVFSGGGATIQIGGDKGEGGAAPPSREVMKAAEEACRSLQPMGPGGEGPVTTVDGGSSFSGSSTGAKP